MPLRSSPRPLRRRPERGHRVAMGMLKERKKELLLGALLIAIAVVVWQNLAGGGAPGTAAPEHGGSAPRLNLQGAKNLPPDLGSLSAPPPTHQPHRRKTFTHPP